MGVPPSSRRRLGKPLGERAVEPQQQWVEHQAVLFVVARLAFEAPEAQARAPRQLIERHLYKKWVDPTGSRLGSVAAPAAPVPDLLPLPVTAGIELRLNAEGEFIFSQSDSSKVYQWVEKLRT